MGFALRYLRSQVHVVSISMPSHHAFTHGIASVTIPFAPSRKYAQKMKGKHRKTVTQKHRYDKHVLTLRV